MSGASSWSFREDDAKRIQVILSGFLGESNARTALIVDRTGQMVTTVGQAPAFDPTAFASLTAADFSANDQLARMLGESEFGALFNQGERDHAGVGEAAGQGGGGPADSSVHRDVQPRWHERAGRRVRVPGRS